MPPVTPSDPPPPPPPPPPPLPPPTEAGACDALDDTAPAVLPVVALGAVDVAADVVVVVAVVEKPKGRVPVAEATTLATGEVTGGVLVAVADVLSANVLLLDGAVLDGTAVTAATVEAVLPPPALSPLPAGGSTLGRPATEPRPLPVPALPPGPGVEPGVDGATDTLVGMHAA
jgi:hypothetical protein